MRAVRRLSHYLPLLRLSPDLLISDTSSQLLTFRNPLNTVHAHLAGSVHSNHPKNEVGERYCHQSQIWTTEQPLTGVGDGEADLSRIHV